MSEGASRVCGARQTSLREPQSLGAATVLGLEHFCSVPERVKCPFQKATERNSAPRGVGKSRHFLGGATLDIPVRSIANIRRLFTYNGSSGITVRGDASQIALAEW